MRRDRDATDIGPGRRAVAIVVRAVRAAVIALSCSLLVAPAIATRVGWEVVVVGGASMHPTIPIGSLLVERPPRSDELRAGAVVTYRERTGVRTTHRIIGVDRVAGRTVLHTQGDANRSRDAAPVDGAAVDGLVIWSLPLLGYATVALAGTWGVVTALAMVATLTALEWLVGPPAGVRGATRPRRRSPGRSRGTTG